MTVDTMRKIDYFVGVPLCVLVTLFMRIACFFTKTTSNPPSNILLIELSEMGSTILADPAMKKLQRSFNANLFFVIFAKNRPSLDLLGTVAAHNVFTIRDNGIVVLALDTFKFMLWTRAMGIDTVIDLELFSRFTALMSAVSGAQRRVGFYRFCNEGLNRGDILTHKVAYNPHQHISKNFIALVNALLAKEQEIPFSKSVISDEEIDLRRLEISQDRKDTMLQKVTEFFPDFDAKRHRIVLVNANASELLPQRCWPQANYAILIQELLARFQDVIILCTGSPSERAGINSIVQAVRDARCINFAGTTALTELVALYSISALMVSNDSGPAHFASVTAMPAFVLFGPETPLLYGPLGDTTCIYAHLSCSPCVSAFNHRKTPCNDNVCLQQISPEQVLGLVAKRLEAQVPS